MRRLSPFTLAKTLFCVVYFVVGVLCARFSQELAYGLFFRAPQWYSACINVTKVHFIVLITVLSSATSPTKLVITYDAAQMPEDNNFRVDDAGNLVADLSPRAVFISNHQIYTDWMFLWFVSYASNMASAVYIVMKASLGKVPILGQGMSNYKFLFLLRKWETDKISLTNQLLEIDADSRGLGPASGVSRVATTSDSEIVTWPKGDAANKWPYHLYIFPEGTVISAHTRERSNKFLAASGQAPLRHVLLPRVRGLFLVLRSLRGTVDVVYDVTFGYAGLAPTDYGEDIYTLKGMYFMGNGPPSVSLYYRGYDILAIPLGDDDEVDIDNVDPQVLAAFEQWLTGVWQEKDERMATFFATGTFADPANTKTKTVVADFKLRTWAEAAAPFGAPLAFLLVARLAVRYAVRLAAFAASYAKA